LVEVLKIIKVGILVAIGLIASLDVQATHIRAGEIIAERIDALRPTYRFTFIGYRDTESGVQFGDGGAVFDLGDGFQIPVTRADFQLLPAEQLAPNIVKEQFQFVHTYNAASSYVVSYSEDFRNAGISNMENSVNTSFYTETLVVIDDFLGPNNSPVLTVPPIDEGTPGVRFVHNPGAYDPDGDLLVYIYDYADASNVYNFVQPREGVLVPKQTRNNEVFNYRELNNPDFYENFARGSESGGPPTLFMDPESGDLTWDSPGDIFELSANDCPEGVDRCSEYNIAIRVEEWRNTGSDWIRVGYVTRDMQVIVYEGDNNKPTLEVPPAICVEAGTRIEQTIQGSDPDGHQVQLEAFGGPLLVDFPSPAIYTPNPPVFSGPPGFLEFTWQTVCGHVRARPYEIQFKVTDNPIEDGVKVGPSLVEFETWEITVVGPKPTGLSVEPNTGRSANLSWEGYSCDNASQMQVWRRVGDFTAELDDCEVGIPAGSGYQLVGTVDIGETSFTDDNLAPGAKYCYRLVAVFPEPGEGESYVSDEVCITLQADAPVMTNVDITNTSDLGEINVAWIPPLEVDESQFPPPFQYQLLRSDNAAFSNPVVVSDIQSETTFTDTGINTASQTFYYQVALYDNGGNFVDSSAVAGSVRLNPTPLLQSIEVNWQAQVPWSNSTSSAPYHYIYRDNVLQNDPLRIVLIDSVQVLEDGFRYLDDGRFNNVDLDEEIEYCYYVTTFGGYDNPLIPEPLVNRSQIVCVRPNDNEPPCPPINVVPSSDFNCEAAIVDLGCNVSQFENAFFWEADIAGTCDDDISFYRIYYSSTGLEEDYVELDSTINNNYIHGGLSSFKGCYAISAVDRSGNESERSEPLCYDNCPNYILPNVFTPNGDGINDTFGPFYSGTSGIENFDNANCPRFVLSVDFQVFDRDGSLVYDLSRETEQSILINWDGRNNTGLELPVGIYFYVAEVEFDVLATSNSTRTYNGWVQILR
jgi:hypothetical protein